MIGTIGVLLLAKQNKIISSISESIATLQNSGLWLSDDLIKFMKEQAGEVYNVLND